MSDNHGNTPAAWAGSGVAMVAFLLGSVALLRNPANVTLLWVAIVLGAAALPVFLVMSKMGYNGGSH